MVVILSWSTAHERLQSISRGLEISVRIPLSTYNEA